MLNSLKILVAFFTALILLNACEKGTPVVVQSFMKLRMNAFYTDTSLYYQVKLNDKIINERSAVGGNSLELIADKDIQFVESGKLVISIVKKSNPNLLLDTTLYFTTLNDFLLVQLDPKQKPLFINKKTEPVTLTKPGKDSVKIRFYYNETDELKRNGILMNSIDLQLYSYDVDSLFMNGVKEPPLKNEGRLRDIKKGALSNYYTLAYKDKNGKRRGYVCEIFPPASTAASQPVYKRTYDEYDGFIGGGLSLADIANGTFETFRITKPDKNSPYRFGKYLFSY